MLPLVALSDLHLGDRDLEDGSVLTDPAARRRLAQQLGDLSLGAIDTLVLCGDLTEACVPTRDSSERTDGLNLYAAPREDTNGFFSALTDEININRVIWIPGNHDLGLYRWLRVLGITSGSLYTNPAGIGLRTNGKWCTKGECLATLFGEEIPNIGLAYPNFQYSAQSGWPIALFTHGHLFDKQVLAPSAEFLAALGLLAETGHLYDAVPENLDVDPGQWMNRLSAVTTTRIANIWPMNLSKVEEAVYNAVKRRKIHVVCQHLPVEGYSTIPAKDQGPIETAGSGTGAMDAADRLKWYVDGYMMDLSPVLFAADRQRPSYLIKGHTHDAGAGKVTSLDGVTFKVYDLGGWTKDAAGHHDNVPHTHVLAWRSFPGEPETYAMNVIK